jgi:hypothetical protein
LSAGLTTATCSGLCLAGSYSTGGATSAACTPCPAGTYGFSPGLATAALHLPVPRGLVLHGRRHVWRRARPAPRAPTGPRTGLTVGCVLGLVPPGSYSVGGATLSSCTLCPAGAYGTAAGLQNAACSGSRVSGTYSLAGATSAACTPCPAGTYGSAPGCPPLPAQASARRARTRRAAPPRPRARPAPRVPTGSAPGLLKLIVHRAVRRRLRGLHRQRHVPEPARPALRVPGVKQAGLTFPRRAPPPCPSGAFARPLRAPTPRRYAPPALMGHPSKAPRVSLGALPPVSQPSIAFYGSTSWNGSNRWVAAQGRSLWPTSMRSCTVVDLGPILAQSGALAFTTCGTTWDTFMYAGTAGPACPLTVAATGTSWCQYYNDNDFTCAANTLASRAAFPASSVSSRVLVHSRGSDGHRHVPARERLRAGGG